MHCEWEASESEEMYIKFYLASIGFHCCLSTKLYAVDKGNGKSLWCTCADVTSRGSYIHLKNVCVYISSACFVHVCDLSIWWSIKSNFLSSVYRPQPLARRGESPKLSVGDFWAKARKQNLLTKGKNLKHCKHTLSRQCHASKRLNCKWPRVPQPIRTKYNQ